MLNVLPSVGRSDIWEPLGCRDQGTQVVSTWKVVKKQVRKRHTVKETNGEKKTLSVRGMSRAPHCLPPPGPLHVSTSKLTLCSPDSPWLHHLHPQGLQQSLMTYWLTVSLIFPLSFPCLSSPYNWNKNYLREEPMLYNFPSHSTVPGPDLNTIKEVLFNMCLGTEIQYCPYTKGRLCPRLTTSGFCKCSMMCFQEFDSHGCIAALHFTSRLLERLIYTTVSMEQLSSCTTGFTGFWSHNFTGNTLRKSQWAMLPKPVLHKAYTSEALEISSTLAPSLFAKSFLLPIS